MTRRLGCTLQNLSCKLNASTSPLPRRSILRFGLLLSFMTQGGRSAAETMQEKARKVEYGLENGYELSASPWRAPEGSLEEAADEILRAMPLACEGSQLIASQSSDEGEYLRFQTDGMFGPDIVEFVVKADTTAARNWEGDDRAPIVLYRSISGQVKYIYPFQRPISDMGAQKKRMERIRATLGWRKVGCELLECYQ